MSIPLKYVISDIGAGWIGILGSDRGLLRISLPQPSLQEAQHRLSDSANGASWSPHLFQNLVERLRTYFSGQEVAFSDELDLSGATPFQRLVWEKAKLIPYGETRSYAWIAEQLNQPAAGRAVGQALGRNPLPVIIPCHRVITADGKLGGYSEGPDVKRYLLQLEASSRNG
ncbi:MAG: methylated-DNA--[protein]-cysteine S-methyltransferase [Chloroflexi bacterium]|nr:methylated-DNA--[protein]-cysteine S-methyltransferase [Chloroflexota bacterium]